MGLFGVHKKSVAIMDIGSSSVGGAFVHYVEGKQPVICYTTRIAIEPREGEHIATDMLRALDELATRMVREGAPELRTVAGSGNVHTVLAAVGSPWQATNVRVETVRKDKPFTFTKATMEEATKRNDANLSGRIESGESVISTVLNGYETADPFGKKISRADMVILSSSLEAETAEKIEATLRRTFHAHDIKLAGFAPVAYEILRDLYPAQKDFLVLDVSGTATDLAFVKRGLLADVCSIESGVHDLLKAARGSGITSDGLSGIGVGGGGIIDPARNARFANHISAVQEEWLTNLKKALTLFSERHALPRTVFLLADEDVRDFLKRLLDTSTLRSLWLSEEPLSIIPVLPEQLAPVVSTRGEADGDPFLAMLALYYQRRD